MSLTKEQHDAVAAELDRLRGLRNIVNDVNASLVAAGRCDARTFAEHIADMAAKLAAAERSRASAIQVRDQKWAECKELRARLALLSAAAGDANAWLARLSNWTHEYGAALCPTAGSADSFGDGMRARSVRCAASSQTSSDNFTGEKMSTAIVTQQHNGQELTVAEKHNMDAAERAIVMGDLSKLDADQRLILYRQTCHSVGLNPLTQPFAYIELDGKLTMYARAEASAQLRRIHDVSITIIERGREDDMIWVRASAKLPSGREDESIAYLPLIKWNKQQQKYTTMGPIDLANAHMKCETKAKRRVTFSICGLGMLDESDLDSIEPATAPIVMDAEPVKERKTRAKPGDLVSSLAVGSATIVPNDPGGTPFTMQPGAEAPAVRPAAGASAAPQPPQPTPAPPAAPPPVQAPPPAKAPPAQANSPEYDAALAAIEGAQTMPELQAAAKAVSKLNPQGQQRDMMRRVYRKREEEILMGGNA